MSVTATSRDEWLPTSETQQAASTSSSSGGVDGPSITFETTAGHQVVLTYHDMVMLALLATVAIAAARGAQ